jgi:hypothetical protein
VEIASAISGGRRRRIGHSAVVASDQERTKHARLAPKPWMIRGGLALLLIGSALIAVGIGGGAAQSFAEHPDPAWLGVMLALAGVAVLWLCFSVRR